VGPEVQAPSRVETEQKVELIVIWRQEMELRMDDNHFVVEHESATRDDVKKDERGHTTSWPVPLRDRRGRILHVS